MARAPKRDVRGDGAARHDGGGAGAAAQVDRTFAGRIIAATNQDLRKHIADGKFRDELYQRLAVDEIRTPTLREQLADAPGDLDRKGPGADVGRRRRVVRANGVKLGRVPCPQGAATADGCSAGGAPAQVGAGRTHKIPG
jgi:hypothetical protein